MPLYFIKFPNKKIHIPGLFEFWMGFGSTVLSNGPIMSFIVDYLSKKEEKTLFICQKADGHYDIPIEIEAIANYEEAPVIAAVVAGVKQVPRFFYCPASDDFFMHEIYEVFGHHRVPWTHRKDVMFWRGGVSGREWRVNIVKECLAIPQTDVKFVDCYSRPGECSPTDTPEMFADKVDVTEHLNYKALLYIDGNSSASNVTWIFASGAVPIFVNKHEFWFRDKLVPWVHYVPVEWDLSDLREKIQWVWDNDDKARHIAENALEFSRTVLSCDNQREYIKDEIDRIIAEYKQGRR